MKLLLSTYISWVTAYALNSSVLVNAFAPASITGPSVTVTGGIADFRNSHLSFGIDGLDSLETGYESKASVDKRPVEDIAVYQTLEEVKRAKEYLGYIEEDNDFDGVPNNAQLHKSLGKVVMVSGFAYDSADEAASSSIVFDLLNNAIDEDLDNFSFEKIVAFSKDTALAKKRLVSRRSRYTGLLTKLDYAESSASVPTAEQLEGVSSWVARVPATDAATLLPAISAAAVAAPSVKHVAVLVEGATDDSSSKIAMEDFAGSTDGDYARSLVALGTLTGELDGRSAYHVSEISADTDSTILPAGATLSRAEGYRLLTDCLALECTSGKAFAVYEYGPEQLPKAAVKEDFSGMTEDEIKERNEKILAANKDRIEAGVEAVTFGKGLKWDLTPEEKTERGYRRLVRGLREMGYSRTKEFEHVVTIGVEPLIEHFLNPKIRKKRNGTDVTFKKPEAPSEEALAKLEAEAEEEQRLMRENQLDPETLYCSEIKYYGSPAELRAKTDEAKIIDLARDWCSRRYFAIKEMGGPMAVDLPGSEAEYREKMWDQALVVAETKFRELNRKNSKRWDSAQGSGIQAEKDRIKEEAILNRLKGKLLESLE